MKLMCLQGTIKLRSIFSNFMIFLLWAHKTAELRYFSRQAPVLCNAFGIVYILDSAVLIQHLPYCDKVLS